MTISVFTLTTNSERWKYPYREALASFLDLADEVVVVDGGSDDGSAEEMKKISPRIKVFDMPWPWEYGHEEYPKHLNYAYQQCTGDWVIRMDIDHLIHEKDIDDIRQRLEGYIKQDVWICSMAKFYVINKSRGFNKARLPVAYYKKKLGSGISFGINTDIPSNKQDWLFPILGGKVNELGVPCGKSIPSPMVKDLGVQFWNYDSFFRTIPEAREYFARVSRAWRKRIDDSWGKDDEDSWKKYMDAIEVRKHRVYFPLTIDNHPKYIRERIRNMTPDQLGFNNWGTIP